jgi:hypothetical protein
MAFAKSPAQMNLVPDPPYKMHGMHALVSYDLVISRANPLISFGSCQHGLTVGYLTMVSLALATMAASSSSVMSIARLKAWVSEVLNVGTLPKARSSRAMAADTRAPGVPFSAISASVWMASAACLCAQALHKGFSESPVYCGGNLPPPTAFALILAANEPCPILHRQQAIAVLSRLVYTCNRRGCTS